MKQSHRYLIVLLILLFLQNVIALCSSQAKSHLKPLSVPNDMPNKIIVELDDTELLCPGLNCDRNRLGLLPLRCGFGFYYPEDNTKTIVVKEDGKDKIYALIVTMDEYAEAILKQETTGFADAVLEAQAIACRSVGWSRASLQVGTNDIYIIGTGYIGGFRPNHTEAGDPQRYANAVARTSAQYLSHSTGGKGNSKVVDALFSSDHGPNNGTYLTVDGSAANPHLESVYDPVLPEVIGAGGHGWGLAQLSADNWAYGEKFIRNRRTLQKTSTYERFPTFNSRQSLAHFYTGVHIRNGFSGANVTPEYRWNPLEVEWQATSNLNPPPQLVKGQNYSLTLVAQNTGTVDFTGNNKERFYEQKNRRYLNE